MKSQQTQPHLEEAELEQAEQVETYIRQRMNGLDPSARVESLVEEHQAVDQLLYVARHIKPEPLFVDSLETALMQMDKSGSTPQSAWRLFTIPRWGSKRQWATAAMGIALVLVLILAGTPTSRGAILKNLFGLSFVSEIELQGGSVEIVQPNVSTDSRAFDSLETMSEAMSTSVRFPSWIPDKLTFTRGWVEEADNGVPRQSTIVYHPKGVDVTPQTPYLMLNMSTHSDLQPLLPVEQAQWVLVDSESALYIQGRWQGTPSGQNMDDLQWDLSADTVWLSWDAYGWHHLLVADELNLDRATLIRIAESLGEPSSKQDGNREKR
ncbi:MAG: hypothetical protein AAF702_09970 [Chloroflexota bacterium]